MLLHEATSVVQTTNTWQCQLA